MSLEFGMLLDFTYGEIVSRMNPEQREQFENEFKTFEQESEAADEGAVEWERPDGEVVVISQARLERLRANARAMSHRPRKGQVVR